MDYIFNPSKIKEIKTTISDLVKNKNEMNFHLNISIEFSSQKLLFRFIFPNSYPIEPPTIFKFKLINHTNQHINLNSDHDIQSNTDRLEKFDLNILTPLNWNRFITFSSIIYSLELQLISQYKSKLINYNDNIDITNVNDNFKKLDLGLEIKQTSDINYYNNVSNSNTTEINKGDYKNEVVGVMGNKSNYIETVINSTKQTNTNLFNKSLKFYYPRKYKEIKKEDEKICDYNEELSNFKTFKI